MLTWNPSRTIRQRWRNSSATNVASNFVSKVSVSGICACWKSNLTETAKGMNISGTRYTPMEVDKRSFSEYMYYGPIPYSEVLKYDELKQNQGW